MKNRTRIRPLARKTKVETIVIEDEQLLSPHSYCLLPTGFFDRALGIPNDGPDKKVLTVATWDGRTVMSINTKVS
ncbi:MAG: hypothetical protein K1X79_03000 [Oligoflexia bacterium]|nr:hypothetical protein [Oligoflexia bacterium]